MPPTTTLNMVALTGARALPYVYPQHSMSAHFVFDRAPSGPRIGKNSFLVGHWLQCEERSSERAAPKFGGLPGQARG
eukprot:4219800-Pyramimonas_sp.AAC.1